MTPKVPSNPMLLSVLHIEVLGTVLDSSGGWSENICIGKTSNGAAHPMVKKTDGTYCRTSSNAPAKVTAKLKERKEREEREVEFI